MVEHEWTEEGFLLLKQGISFLYIITDYPKYR